MKKVKKVSKKTKKEKIEKLIPSKELQKAFDLMPKIVKRNEKAAKEKAKIIKNFRSVEHKIFAKS